MHTGINVDKMLSAWCAALLLPIVVVECQEPILPLPLELLDPLLQPPLNTERSPPPELLTLPPPPQHLPPKPTPKPPTPKPTRPPFELIKPPPPPLEPAPLNSHPVPSEFECDNELFLNSFDGFHRLPTSVTPLSYQITLQPSFNNFTFVGEEVVNVFVQTSTNEIKLNAHELILLNASYTDTKNKKG